MKVSFVVVAGGRGTRMGTDRPKQFLTLCGRPILMHTLDNIRKACACADIIVVLPEDSIAEWRQMVADSGFDVSHRVTKGGGSRWESVRNGLALVADEADRLVAVHDGVRPFVDGAMVERCLTAAAESGCAIPAVQPVETVRMMDCGDGINDGTSRLVDRDKCRLIQTPQVFLANQLKQAYRQPFSPAFTDDASVAEQAGMAIRLVEGDRRNIKITTPLDLAVAEAFIEHS